MQYNTFQDRKMLQNTEDSGWGIYAFTDLLLDDSRNVSKIKKRDYLESGLYPIVDQSAELIGGYSDIEDGFYNGEDYIVFGDHTRRLKYITFPAFVGADGTKVFKNRNQELVKTKYLYYFLKTVTLPDMGYSRHFKFLKEVLIPVPKLDIQNKIVELLDLIVELTDKRQQQIEALSELKQSVFLDMFGDPITNHKGWNVKALGDLGKWRSGGTPRRKNIEYYTGTIPWLSSGELNDMYVYDSKEHITEQAIEESSAKLIEENSILLGMYDTAGLKSSINKMVCSCNQAIAFSKLNEEIASTEFIYQTIQIMREYLLNQQRGVRQKNFNLTMIKNIKVILPPVELQRKFTSRVKKITRTNEQLSKTLYQYERLYNTILHKAFNGELFKEKAKA